MKDRECYVENEMKTKSPFQFVKSAIKMLFAFGTTLLSTLVLLWYNVIYSLQQNSQRYLSWDII